MQNNPGGSFGSPRGVDKGKEKEKESDFFDGEERGARLYRVKGGEVVYVREVGVVGGSLNDGDVFVLDAQKSLYVWMGLCFFFFSFPLFSPFLPSLTPSSQVSNPATTKEQKPFILSTKFPRKN